MPLFLHLYSVIQYITEHNRIASHTIYDEAWAGWCFSVELVVFSLELVVFKVTVSSGIFGPSSPPHLGTQSSRAVSEW
jgi:hypothetical protein